MDLRKLQRVVIDALEDVKAQDIRVYDTTKLSELFDRVVIATGSSNRQTRSLAMSVKEEVNAKGGEVISIEGLETGEWVLAISSCIFCNRCCALTISLKACGVLNLYA